MRDTPYSVLFLCTANSARSILAEAILARQAGSRFMSLSAGSQPRGQIHPLALNLLQQKGYDISGFRSKSWDEFDESQMANGVDFVFTVCDSAAAEVCPVWPGHPLTAHWGIADPAAASGSEAEQRLAFVTAYNQLKARIDAFIALPDLGIDRLALKAKLQDIGRL
ncbi:arsenate reductase ArsC [Maricaulis sp.]|uniref:arsenate reductase ArsC n=1 Tax=Maricaulis sp. TaxID=1486257 RepID=UPI0026109B9C|nr:arsenate reductase ArsC [Maricaulis sp.]